MSTYDEIEDIAVTFDDGEDDICEICFMDEWDHEDSCPNSPSNRFFDEEVAYGYEIDDLT